ncbi:MAG: tRNA (guanosine(37)-N1)-methyltransferase TrmD [Chloroflexi bacterium]|nr:tRNA (guanosine(37)-N1)-methyltransferase TrmD [Chloroflexota bacterium]
MRIDVLTIFPQMFDVPFSFGIFKRAIDRNLVKINVHNIRDYTHDKHHTVDDYPYGGGPGMVLKPGPVFDAVAAVQDQIVKESGGVEPPVILLTPQGRLFNQQIATELSGHSHLVLICGHYEGIDERVVEHLVTDEISIGDYVLTGGELPALVVIDAVLRLLPGVLGSEDSAQEDSHVHGLLEYPQYTRPADFQGWPVPEVLLSGNHAQIARWRREQIVRRTLERRPDLINSAELGREEKEMVKQMTASNKAKSSLNKEPEK